MYRDELHTEGIVGCRWNNHGWMVILHLIRYVPYIPTVCCYDQTIVDCVDEKEEEEEKNRAYSLLQLMASYTGGAVATRKASKQKKGSVYVIEDTTRRRRREKEREREREKGKAKNMNGIRC